VTVIVKVPVAELPAASVALHVTVVVPIANVEPEAGVHTGVSEPPPALVAEAE
jgi:hypothetical protein